MGAVAYNSEAHIGIELYAGGPVMPGDRRAVEVEALQTR